MEKVSIKKFVTFADLKARTVKTIKGHKTMLCQVNYENKNVVSNYGKLRLSSVLQNDSSFIFFIKLNFFCEELRFSDFLSVLRNNRVNYLIVDATDFKNFSSYYSDFLGNGAHQGSLLIIDTCYEEEYYRVMNYVLALERELTENTVNHFRLLFVREKFFILLFNAKDTSLRKIYELKKTKQSILLETLSILNYPTLTLIDGSGRVLSELAHVFNTLSVLSRPSFSEIK